MKTIKLSMIGLLLLMGALSCKKDASTSASASVTSDQAADLASSAMASNSGGIASMSDDVSANAAAVTSTNTQSVNSLGVNSVKQECGTTLTDSATFSGTTSLVTFNYYAKYTHTLFCNAEEQPDSIVNNLTYNGTFSGPRVSTTATGTAIANISGLGSTSTDYVINGQYNRAGTFQSKVGNMASGNSNLSITITNLTLARPGRTIVSGSGTFTLTGVAGKTTYSFTGTITFNGDGTATLNVTGGSSYTVTLASGAWVRR